MVPAKRTYLIVGLLSCLCQAQTRQLSAKEEQAFLDLKNVQVLMDLSAHPDDEDGATLAYYRMKYGVKTYSVFFTRGEGGQNEVGPQLYEELGVLRTEETKAAARILGSEVLFLNFEDFGFSKTATETLEKWGGAKEVLQRLVYVIRKYKPDVLFTNHNTVAGHGQHQVVAITAISAFDAAADSAFFPEQLKEPGLTLWQPKKLYFRASRGDHRYDVANAVEDTNRLRQESYLDIASEALRQHLTQGMEKADLRRFAHGYTRYKLMRENSTYVHDSTSFFGGIQLWQSTAAAALQDIHRTIASLDPTIEKGALLSSVSRLYFRIDSAMTAVPHDPLVQRILHQWLNGLEAITQFACGISASLVPSDSVVVPRQKVDCALTVDASECTLSGVQYQFDMPRGWTISERVGAAPVVRSDRYIRDFTMIVGETPLFTVPKRVAQYNPIDVTEQVVVHVRFLLAGNPLWISFAPHFDVAPPQVLSVHPAFSHVQPSQSANDLGYLYMVENFLPHKMAGRISAICPTEWKGESSSFVIAHEDSTASGVLVVSPPDYVAEGDYPVKFRTEYARNETMVRAFDVSVAPNISVGVVQSYDTTVVQALRELGVRYHLLTPDDLEQRNLREFNSIVVDIRAYLVRKDLVQNNARLLQYVEDGGNLVVMYQKTQEWKPSYAPYQFTITHNRVTREDAPIEILAPGHPLLNKPNRITADAWNGWIQERGLYFPGDVPEDYTRLLSSHDPDEPPLATGYLVASYGKGSYIYTSYVWYRELKNCVPGAYRVFANMISYPAYRKEM